MSHLLFNFTTFSYFGILYFTWVFIKHNRKLSIGLLIYYAAVLSEIAIIAYIPSLHYLEKVVILSTLYILLLATNCSFLLYHAYHEKTKAWLNPALHILIYELGIIFLLAAGDIFIKLGVTWHKIIYDPLFLKIDSSLGFLPAIDIWHTALQFPTIDLFLKLIYFSISLAFFVISADYYKRHGVLPYRFLCTYVLTGVAGLMLYNIAPVVGPAYAYHTWPHFFPGTIAPRNGEPSLHAAWILIAWCYAMRGSFRFRLVVSIWLFLMLLSTLTTGEHYLIDLLLGLIFGLGLQAFCATHLSFRNRIRQIALAASVIVYIIWMFLIFNGVDFLMNNRIITICIWSATLVLVLILLYLLEKQTRCFNEGSL